MVNTLIKDSYRLLATFRAAPGKYMCYSIDTSPGVYLTDIPTQRRPSVGSYGS